MSDQLTAGLIGLGVIAVDVLTPLVGAVVAANHIRKRGRNARLAMAGCLVMALAPVVSTIALTLWLEPLIRATDPVLGANLVPLFTLPFQLVGFGLLLAGALSEPKPRPAQPLPPIQVELEVEAEAAQG
ncbi:hypothetical protein ACFV4F_11385 [Kitasatospora sp. NPDC059722]|uniref:hypothetical protein n=1 Tax=unclassified Kitasatospora TaxID=2633591 RepID=UPI00365412D2